MPGTTKTTPPAVTVPDPPQHPEGQQNGSVSTAASSFYVNPQYLPGGKKSLCGISIRAYGLGVVLGCSSLIAAELALFGYGVWRAPFFAAVLAVFHYLEFDMTARYNTPDAGTTSFLLLSNGAAYSAAHATAMLEVLLRYFLRSEYRPDWLTFPNAPDVPVLLPTVPTVAPLVLGLSLILLGQTARSAAMKQATTNFNHLVQFYKKEDHVLVTDGIYAWSRHPSYFGFFWWALGTQLVLGNHFCFLAYAAVLWKFFSLRILRRYDPDQSRMHC